MPYEQRPEGPILLRCETCGAGPVKGTDVKRLKKKALALGWTFPRIAQLQGPLAAVAMSQVYAGKKVRVTVEVLDEIAIEGSN